MTTLSGRTAVVTGASRGIGLAIAGALVGSGMNVWMLARGCKALAEAVESLGPGARTLCCDVLDAVQVQSAVEQIRREGPVDVLINNAGIFTMDPLQETDYSTFEETIGVNLIAPFRFLRALVPAMSQRGTGHVVMIGSVADRTIFPGNAAYASSKYGARALMEVLRVEMRGTGLRSTLISPSPTDTSLWDRLDAERGAPVRERSTMLSPIAVADAVLWTLTRPANVNIDELRLSHS